MAADAIVRARIDAETKKKAAVALKAMGLTTSDAIRLLMLRVANEQRLPFEVGTPNRPTVEAMKELESGKGRRFENAEDLFDNQGL